MNSPHHRPSTVSRLLYAIVIAVLLFILGGAIYDSLTRVDAVNGMVGWPAGGRTLEGWRFLTGLMPWLDAMPLLAIIAIVGIIVLLFEGISASVRAWRGR